MRKRSPTQNLVLSVCIAALLGGGCGEDPETADKQDSADSEAAEDVGDTGNVFRFDPDTTGSSGASTQDSSGAIDTAAGGSADAVAGVDSGGGPIDTGSTTAVITSCKGKCGLYLEDNPCHCSAACLDEKNCCADFEVMCSCKVNKDCDDNNVCTTDSCQAGTCKQIPFQNCCQSDAECKGSTTCKKATCLDGSCTLINKNCDDGIECTVDVCDEKDGACSHQLPPTKCLIDGFCAHAGDKKPGSTGCSLCQPDIDAKNWTAKAGTCVIGGKCYNSGTENPASSCQVCDASKSGDGWSVKSGHCFVDGACYVSGQNPPGGATCAVCQPSQSQTEWSGAPGTCAVGSGTSVQCLKKGDPGPAGACAVCDPSKSTAGYTLQAGWCLIEGKCVKGGTTGLAELSCSACSPDVNSKGWTPKKKGEACDDGDACTDATLCNAEGKCVGKTVPGCCKSDGECDHLKAQAKACEVPICLKGSGKCELQKLSANECCTEGKCCDSATKKVLPKGTKCSDFKVGAQYQCDGKAVQKRDLFPGCSGAHGKECKTGAEFHAGGPWTTVKTCGDKESCVLSNPSSQPVCKATPP